jgi:hypothetical protein
MHDVFTGTALLLHQFKLSPFYRDPIRRSDFSLSLLGKKSRAGTHSLPYTGTQIWGKILTFSRRD